VQEAQQAPTYTAASGSSKLTQLPWSKSQKSITIKKILNDIERDIKEVEEENYVIVKEKAEQRMIKENPKLFK